MEVYVFLVEKIEEDCYKLKGLSREHYNLFWDIKDDLENHYDIITPPDYKQGAYKAAERLVEDICDSEGLEICIFLDEKYAGKILNLLSSFHGSLSDFELVKISGGKYSVEITMFLDEATEEDEDDEVHFDPNMETFAHEERYDKPVLKDHKKGSCLN